MSVQRALVSVHDARELPQLVQGLLSIGVAVSTTPHSAPALADLVPPVPVIDRIEGLPDLLIANFLPLHPGTGETFDDKIWRQADLNCTELARYAALQHERAAVVVDPADYREVLSELGWHGRLSLALRRRLAAKALTAVVTHDIKLIEYLTSFDDERRHAWPKTQVWLLERARELADAHESPQGGALYRLQDAPAGSLARALDVCIGSTPRRMATYVDAEIVWDLVTELERPALALARGGVLFAAAMGPSLERALDTLSGAADSDLTGASVGANSEMDEPTTRALLTAEIAGIVAPCYDLNGGVLLNQRPEVALLATGDRPTATAARRVRQVSGGFLEWDARSSDAFAQAITVSRRHADLVERRALAFAWRVGQHLSGGAAVLVRCIEDSCWTVALAGGQRSLTVALSQALAEAGHRAAGCVLACPTGALPVHALEQALTAGVTACVMPGDERDTTEAAEAATRARAALLLV